jgi:hypothetical protein
VDWLVNLSTKIKYTHDEQVWVTANRIDQGSEVNMQAWIGLTFMNAKTMINIM